MNSFYVITSPPNQMIRTFRLQPIGPDFFYLHHTISADSKYHSEIQCIYARNITLEISMFYARNITLIFMLDYLDPFFLFLLPLFLVSTGKYPST